MSWPTEEMKRASLLRNKMLPEKPLEGRRGYYPVLNQAEWEDLPAIYKAVTWNPHTRVYNDKTRQNEKSRPKNVIYNTVYEDAYGCSCYIYAPIENAAQIHMSLLPQESIFSGSTIAGIQFENGTSYSAEKKWDPETGSMSIYSYGQPVGIQGGCHGHIPEGISYQDATGKWTFEKPSSEVTYSKDYCCHIQDKPIPHTTKYMSHTKEEFQDLDRLFRLVEWPSFETKSGKRDVVKDLLFEGIEKTLGIRCTIQTHRENAMKLFTCEMKESIFSGASLKGVKTEAGKVLPARIERDEATGCFGIYSGDILLARQGGYYDYIPAGVFYEPSSGKLNIQAIYNRPLSSPIITNQSLNPYDSGWGLEQDIKKAYGKEKKRSGKPRSR